MFFYVVHDTSNLRRFEVSNIQASGQTGGFSKRQAASRQNAIKTLKSWNHRWRAKNAQRPMPQGSLPPHGHALSRHFVRSNMTMSRETWNCTRDWSSWGSSVDFGIRKSQIVYSHGPMQLSAFLTFKALVACVDELGGQH